MIYDFEANVPPCCREIIDHETNARLSFVVPGRRIWCDLSRMWLQLHMVKDENGDRLEWQVEKSGPKPVPPP